MDTTNCVDFAFSLYTARLMVSMLGTGGAIGGTYDVPVMPLHEWAQHMGRDGHLLPRLSYRYQEAFRFESGTSALIPVRPPPRRDD